MTTLFSGTDGALQVGANTVGATQIVDGSITGTKLASGFTFPAVPINAVNPCFRAYASSATSITTSFNKIILATENFDTTNAFDSVTNSRFQPTIAGYYQINGNHLTGNGTYRLIAAIYKNGEMHSTGSDGTAFRAHVSDIVYLNGIFDYVELFGYSGTTADTAIGINATYMSGSLISRTA